jgi:phosphoglycerate dehydrogenase-like enzyme
MLYTGPKKELLQERRVMMNDQSIHVHSLLYLHEKHLEQIRAVSPRLVVTQRSVAVYQPSGGTSEEFAQALSPEVEILCTHSAPFDLSLTPNLRWIQADTAGVDILNDTPLWRSDIAITTASGIHAVQIGEYVLSMLLHFAHRFPTAARFQAESHWAAGAEVYRFLTAELRGRTLGILGYGAIGREVARLAASFGMRILATRQKERPARFDGWTIPGTGDPDGSLPARFYELTELHELLPQCDMLVLALPLSAQTQHIIGQAELALLPQHAVLVNIGRGPLIDHDALTTALQEEEIFGAALDVTEPEPLPSTSPLWLMENVLITPHIAGISLYYNDRFVDLFCENIRRYLHGDRQYNLVQRDLGY